MNPTRKYRLNDKLKVFKEIPGLQCFAIDDEFQRVSDLLGLTEWHAVVWIGRLFLMDNDFGEHWFDNWDARAAVAEKARKIGIDPDGHDLLIIDPSRMKDGRDGPCHSDEFRRRFWSEILSGLHLSFSLLCDEARRMNDLRKALAKDINQLVRSEELAVLDLDARIALLTASGKDQQA